MSKTVAEPADRAVSGTGGVASAAVESAQADAKQRPLVR
jgi:hypothetical protein